MSPAHRLLVVEDDESIRQNLRWLLEASGYDVVTAADGHEGAEAALREHPDLILCDVMMPRLDGLGMLRKVREQAETAHIPFLFLSARNERLDIREAMAMGADDYIGKPFSTHEVLEAVRARLVRRETAQQTQEQRLDELRTSIARSLPHELRTPLVGVIGFSQILLDEWETLPNGEVREMLEAIYESGKRLERTVENYGLYAHLTIQVGQGLPVAAFARHRAPSPQVEVAEVAEACAAESGRTPDLVLETGAVRDRRQARLSTEHLRRAAHELIGNAFRFSQAGDQVRVRTGFSNGTFELSVADQGPGMSPADVSRAGAFLQFGRDQNEQQGSGLGLAIAQRLAQAYGGSCTIELPERGTVVTFQVPAEDA
jgi:signal transduction histidine kinase